MNDRLNAGPSGTDRGTARLLLHAMMHGGNVVDHVASVLVPQLSEVVASCGACGLASK